MINKLGHPDTSSFATYAYLVIGTGQQNPPGIRVRVYRVRVRVSIPLPMENPYPEGGFWRVFPKMVGTPTNLDPRLRACRSATMHQILCSYQAPIIEASKQIYKGRQQKFFFTLNLTKTSISSSKKFLALVTSLCLLLHLTLLMVHANVTPPSV